MTARWEKGEIDDNQYKDGMDQIRKKHLVGAAGLGFTAVVGTGAGIIAAGAASAAAAPAAIVIGAGVAAGYVAGKAASWLWSYCSGSKTTKSVLAFDSAERAFPSAEAGETCMMSSGNSTVGSSIPKTMGEGGTLVIELDGYAPIVIKNFVPPKDGSQLVIDFKPIPLDQVKPGDTIEIDYSEVQPTASSCSQIQQVTATPSPLDPGPGQSVVVTATVFPVIAGCTVSMSIQGTDGYSNSTSPVTNSNGQTTLYIPGGAEDVFDTVTVISNGKSFTVTYTF